jgi:hypothetical protein
MKFHEHLIIELTDLVSLIFDLMVRLVRMFWMFAVLSIKLLQLLFNRRVNRPVKLAKNVVFEKLVESTLRLPGIR